MAPEGIYGLQFYEELSPSVIDFALLLQQT